MYESPEIFNTDQGVDVHRGRGHPGSGRWGVAIGMDGRGWCRWMDNVFIERLWRMVKYEEVYLHACENGAQARAGFGRLLRVLQHETPAPEPRRADPRGGTMNNSGDREPHDGPVTHHLPATADCPDDRVQLTHPRAAPRTRAAQTWDASLDARPGRPEIRPCNATSRSIRNASVRKHQHSLARRDQPAQRETTRRSRVTPHSLASGEAKVLRHK